MESDKKIISYAKLTSLRKNSDKLDKLIVFTSGCYDMLHLGHVIHFNFCKSKGDILVVSIGNDKTVRDLKGPTRPINNESFRARMVAALGVVDFVVISQESGKLDHNELIALLKPDFYVVPGTDSLLSEKKRLIESVGGKQIACKRLPPGHLEGGISTTLIEKKLHKI